MSAAETAGFPALVERAKSGAMQLIELLQTAERLNVSGAKKEAIELYLAWVENNESPLLHIACFNLGAAISATGDYREAEKWYKIALKQNPDFLQAHLNLGSAYEQQNNFDSAIAQWKAALETREIEKVENKSLKLHALNNLGRLLETRKRYDEALVMLERSLSADKSQKDVVLHLIHLRQRQCLWPVYKPFPNVSKQFLKDWTSPLAMLAESDDPERQLNAAVSFVKHKYSHNLPPVEAPGRYGHEKIRIGYLSSDFCLHPVSMLTVELFELHDREKYEVYGFCWSPDDGSGLRLRVVGAMDRFYKIGHLSDEDAARAIRSFEIDVLVDLQGLTSGARPHILAHKPAPVVVTYLGFPGPTGLPWVDYVVADDYIIPKEYERHFTEKPLRMDRCFQVSDSRRPVGNTPTRAENGLPEDAFIFCAFNNNYKYTEEVFHAWMRILKKVPGSVLWLLADNKWARENMLAYAKKSGVKPERLIFATRVLPPDYLARYRIADLFLDTFPFNGGTTANDALFMGLPILTMSGRTFASRMAGSLLNSLGLGELVVSDLKDYEKLAVKLATDGGFYSAFKEKLERNIAAPGSVFDTLAQTRNIERLYDVAYGEKAALLPEITPSPERAAAGLAKEGDIGAVEVSAESAARAAPKPRVGAYAATSVWRAGQKGIVQWLAFHLAVGFNEFNIYVDKALRGEAQELLRLAGAYQVRVFEILSETSPDIVSFMHAYENFGAGVDWMAFLNGDEYLFPTEGQSVGDALARFDSPEVSSVAVFQKCYGSSGHLTEPEGLVTENFRRHAAETFPQNGLCRSVLKGGLTGVGFLEPRFVGLAKGVVDERGTQLGAGLPEGYAPSRSVLRINNYLTRSYEYFMGRINSPALCDAVAECGSVGAFSRFDRNEEDDGASYRLLVPQKLKYLELMEHLYPKS